MDGRYVDSIVSTSTHRGWFDFSQCWLAQLDNKDRFCALTWHHFPGISHSLTDIDHLHYSCHSKEYFVITGTTLTLDINLIFLSRTFLLTIICKLLYAIFSFIIFLIALTKKMKVILKKIKSGNELMLVEFTCLTRFFITLKWLLLLEWLTGLLKIQLQCCLSDNILQGWNDFIGLGSPELEMEIFPLLHQVIH